MPNPTLQPLAVLVGTWTTRGSHPYLPGTTLRGQSSFEWIEGGAFLMMRSHVDDSRFPDGVAIVGSDNSTAELFMLYFDERGVSRKYNFTIDNNVWTWWRDAKDLAQRFTCTIAEDGQTMVGRGEMSKDGGAWEPDIELTFQRASSRRLGQSIGFSST